MRRLALFAMMLLAAPAFAAVERIEITVRTKFADGHAFGAVGAYEKMRGIAHITLDPDLPANARIVDLKRALRDAKGRVLITTDFLLLRPPESIENDQHLIGRLIYTWDDSYITTRVVAGKVRT